MRPAIVIGSREADLCLTARRFLEQSGFKTCLQTTAIATSAAAVRGGVGGVLIDDRLRACLKACRHIRRHQGLSEITIVAITDDKTPTRAMVLLSAGADEIFVRPFSPDHIVRTFYAAGAGLRLAYGDIELDAGARRVWRGDQRIDLPQIEFAILKLFLSRPEHVFGRRDIIAACWPSGIFVELRTVNVHIGRLRKLLLADHSSDPIRSVRGTGYGLEYPTWLQQDDET